MPNLTEARCDRCGQEKTILDPRKGANPLPAHQCWTTSEMTEEFTVHSFAAPFCYVTRKSDGVSGWLEFTHMPRWYFNFQGEHKHNDQLRSQLKQVDPGPGSLSHLIKGCNK